MKEILNSLSEMLDKKEVKTLNIFYEKTGETESISATLTKENENVDIVSDGKNASNITVNIEGITSNFTNLEDLTKEISTLAKRSV